MNLYTDDHPETTLKGLGFKNKKIAKQTISKVEKYFNLLKKKQNIPDWTPNNVRPKIYIEDNNQNNSYYDKQKMYRILGMSNRAKGMIHRIKKNKKIKEAIQVFQEWLVNYKKKKIKI